MLKELAGSGDCHFRDLSNMSAIHFHIEGVPANAVALAVGAATVPAVAGIENTLVHFIRLAFDIIKERSDTDIVILPLPQYLDKFFGKLAVRHINRVAIAGGPVDEVTHVMVVLFSPEARNSAAAYGFVRNGDDDMFIDPGDPAESFAVIARAVWIIKREHLRGGYMKLHAVHFKTFAKRHLSSLI